MTPTRVCLDSDSNIRDSKCIRNDNNETITQSSVTPLHYVITEVEHGEFNGQGWTWQQAGQQAGRIEGKDQRGAQGGGRTGLRVQSSDLSVNVVFLDEVACNVCMEQGVVECPCFLVYPCEQLGVERDRGGQFCERHGVQGVWLQCQQCSVQSVYGQT